MTRTKESHKNFYWGVISEEYSKEKQKFFGMHDRVRDGKCPSIVWPRNLDGFVSFLKCAGKIPDHLEKPSMGRIDHSLGYQPGNIRWEEHRINSIKRKGTKHEFEKGDVEFKTVSFKKGSKEHIEHQKRASAKLWNSPELRLKHSESIKKAWAEGKFKNRKKKGESQ